MEVGESNPVALLDEKTTVTIVPQELVIVTLSLSGFSLVLFMGGGGEGLFCHLIPFCEGGELSL